MTNVLTLTRCWYHTVNPLFCKITFKWPFWSKFQKLMELIINRHNINLWENTGIKFNPGFYLHIYDTATSHLLLKAKHWWHFFFLGWILTLWLNWLFRCLSSLIQLLSPGPLSRESQFQARGVFYQPSCQCLDPCETRAGHKLALKYITHTVMGRGCSQALKYSSDSGAVNGWPLWHISF